MQHLVAVEGARVGVVMSHGVMSHAGWFAGFAEGLRQQGVASIAVDRRGSGAAKDAPGACDPEAWVSDLMAAMDAMKARTPRVVLLGWCWGARSAVVAAARRPPDHLVLMAPGLALTEQVKQRVAEIRASDEDPAPLPFEIEMFSEEPSVIEWIRSDRLAWRSQPRAFIAPSGRIQIDALSALARPKSPMTTFLATTDRIVDNAAITDLVGGRVHQLPGGHALILESPTEVARRVSESIAR